MKRVRFSLNKPYAKRSLADRRSAAACQLLYSMHLTEDRACKRMMPRLIHGTFRGFPMPCRSSEPLSRYGNPESYVVYGKTYHTLSSSKGYKERGAASWYGTKFHGKRTSSGEPYDLYAMTAAHKTLPLPTYVEVTNLKNGRTVIVKVNDRGPFHDDRLIDLSYAAAAKLDILPYGTGEVEVRAIDPTKMALTARTADAAPLAETPDSAVLLPAGRCLLESR